MYKESVEVFRIKISSVGEPDNGSVAINFDDRNFPNPMFVPMQFISDFNPKPGGFFIMRTGGVGSYSDN